MEDKEQMVLEAMRGVGKPVRPAEIAKMTGLESKKVSKLMGALKKKGIISSSKRCFYAPTE